jgi:pSer/pThr/pTyr-binding forkhead associated (FHA) protein
MPAAITLTIIEGTLKGREFILPQPSTCIIGRADGCHVRLPSDADHWTVSRFHCLLDVGPQGVRVRDLGSRNGTYVNGIVIGQRHPRVEPDEAVGLVFPEYELEEGDEVRVGSTVFQVGMEFTEEEQEQPVGSAAVTC